MTQTIAVTRRLSLRNSFLCIFSIVSFLSGLTQAQVQNTYIFDPISVDAELDQLAAELATFAKAAENNPDDIAAFQKLCKYYEETIL